MRRGTPSHNPIPSGLPPLLQVMIFRNRTACLSANFIKPSQSRAVPASRDIAAAIFAGASGSATTSSFHVSRAIPTSRSFSTGCVYGSGVPRSTVPNDSGLVRYSSLEIRSASAGFVAISSPAAIHGNSGSAAALAAPRPRKKRRDSETCSANNEVESRMAFTY